MRPDDLKKKIEEITETRDNANQTLFLTLNTKVGHLEDSVSRLAKKEDLTYEIRQKLNVVRKQWRESSGTLSVELSNQIDKTFIAKHNVQKVVSILGDYENLQDEVKELLLRLEENDTSELAEVYRKLKRYIFLRKKLIEKISRQQALENNEAGADQVEDKLLRIEKKFEGVNEL